MAIKQDIGAYSAYAIAVKHGYEGTEAEWVAAQEKARLDSEAAAEAAQTAQGAAEKARDQAQTAKTGAETAQGAAGQAAWAAQEAATTATQQAQGAQTARDGAETAKNGAETARTGAEDAQKAAKEAQTAAEAAAKEAKQAQTGAESAKTAAEAAQGKAEEAAQGVAEDREQIGANTTGLAEAREELSQTKTELAATQSDLAKAQRAIKLQAKLTQGQVWDFEEDDQEAYQRTVPSGAYAGAVESFGGKTVAWNQVVNRDAFADSMESAGVTYTNNGDGSWTVNGVSTSRSNYAIQKNKVAYIYGHKYLLWGCPKGGSVNTYYLGLVGYNGTTYTEFAIENVDSGTGSVISPTNQATNNGNIEIIAAQTGGQTVSNLVFEPHIVDLTLLYGPGNEPTDTSDPRIAQIEAYAAKHPEYNAGELVSAQVDEVRVVGKNLVEVTGAVGDDNYPLHFPIPAGTTLSASFTGTASADNATALTVWLHSTTGYVAGNSLQFGKVSKGTKRYTASVTVNYVVTLMRIFKDSFWQLFDSVDDFQLEIAPAPTAYSPYHQTTYPIPAAVKALPGYGWSAGSVANTIERTEDGWQYVQRVGSVDLGTLTWYSEDLSPGLAFTAQLASLIPAKKSSHIINALAARYTAVSQDSKWTNKILSYRDENGTRISIIDNDYAAVGDFNSAMQGTPLYYELAEPIVTDITALMGDALDPFDVEPGGSITLHHSAGEDGLELAGTSKIQYITKLSEVST